MATLGVSMPRKEFDPKEERSKAAACTGRHSRGRVRDGASLPVAPSIAEMPPDYGVLLEHLKNRITQERLHIALAANAAMVLLYWDIGRSILQNQSQEGWGGEGRRPFIR